MVSPEKQRGRAGRGVVLVGILGIVLSGVGLGVLTPGPIEAHFLMAKPPRPIGPVRLPPPKNPNTKGMPGLGKNVIESQKKAALLREAQFRNAFGLPPNSGEGMGLSVEPQGKIPEVGMKTTPDAMPERLKFYKKGLQLAQKKVASEKLGSPRRSVVPREHHRVFDSRLSK